MEAEINCEDPQFMNMLETCLRVEIDIAKDTLFGLESDIKNLKVKIRAQLQTRRELSEGAKNTQENIAILTTVLNNQRKYLNETNEKIELMKLNLDNDYKVMKSECERCENICKQYEETWRLYQAKYEQFPLAKTRKEARIELQKLEVNKMLLQYKIAELRKTAAQMQRITWLRMRAKIVELARAFSNRTKLQEQLKSLNDNIKCSKEELDAIDAKLAAQSKREEEERRRRALMVLEMPPPKINFSHMRTIYERAAKADFLDGWRRNYENSIDTMSVDTLVLEERCLAEESSTRSSEEVQGEEEEEEDRTRESQRIDAPSPRLDAEQPEVEHETDAASEPREPIDPHDVQAEQRMDEEPNRAARPFVGNDRRHSGELPRTEPEMDEEANDDPAAKRMRLMRDEGKAVACINPPRIKRIETVRYDVTPMRKVAKASGRLPDRSPVSTSSRMSSAGKINQNDPNPSSMFVPRCYDYSDISVISFNVDENVSNLNVDRMSLDDRSVIRDFCECSNVSMIQEDAEMESPSGSRVNATATGQIFTSPQFDFSNIRNSNSKRSNLF